MSVRPTIRRSLRAICGLAVAGTVLLTACGGGGDSGGSGATASTAIPVLSTASSTATVVLPSGVTIGADKLMVRTSVGQATPNASGALTLTSYVDGEQLAIVLSPAGSPMLMGWIDATHTTLSAATTAQVLAYFALNGSLMLNDAERQALMADLPTAPGIDGVTAVVQSELARSVDAFAQADPALTQALATFANSTFAGARASAAAATRAQALGIVVTPATQSGIEVLQDPPFAAHLTNSLRRRAWAFVDRVSHTTGGVDIADPLAVTNFEVPPVIGVNGGVTGALTDIMSAYYGNQPTAYASITAPDSGSFGVPLVDGSDKTAYQVTVVGPGLSAGVSANLTGAQSLQLNDVALRGFVKDFMVPTLANAVLGSGAIDFTAGQGTTKAKFLADVLTSVTSDFIAFAPTVPGLTDKIVKGQWFDAGVDITSTVAGSNTLRSMLIKGFELAVASRTAAGIDSGPMKALLGSFNTIMNAAGGVLQAFDSSMYVKDLANSDRADQWTLVVSPQKIALNPPASTIGVGGTVVLTASALGVDSMAGFSYHWTTTTQFGDLNEIAGSSRTHQSDYCSSSNEALFVYEKAAAPATTDTVTVQIYSGPNCDPAKGSLLGSAPATIKFGSSTVNVILTQAWTDTGLAVTSGQQLSITATGTMNYWTGSCPSTQNCNVSPAGLAGCASPSDSPGPGLPCNSLIGRIGANGTPFEVGTGLQITVPAGVSGELFLGVDDNNFGDNTGSWTATIQ